MFVSADENIETRRSETNLRKVDIYHSKTMRTNL
jgi:hypothetical protein